MPKVLVLGSGLVGSVLAADLAATRGYRVTVVDRDEAPLANARRRAAIAGGRVSTQVADSRHAVGTFDSGHEEVREAIVALSERP